MNPSPPETAEYKPIRVAVTGLGVVSSIGIGFEKFSAALLKGTDARGPATVIDTDRLRSPVVCEAKDFDPKPWFRRTSPTKAGRASQFAVAAARMAVRDAFADESSLANQPGIVVLGTTDGGSHEIDKLVAAYNPGAESSLDPDLIRKVPADRIARTVVAELGLRRVESFVNGAACSG